MTGARPNSSNAALCAGLALCAAALGVLLAPASLGASSNRTGIPLNCGPTPSWIQSATLPGQAQNAFQGCFSSSSNRAEALLILTNNRPYAQLLELKGGAIEQALSSFSDPLAKKLAEGLSRLSPPNGPSTFMLGPEGRASIAIDRPAPGLGETVEIAPAPANAFAVASQAWKLLSAASTRLSVPVASRSCILAAVQGALQRPPRPERALRRIHACVNTSGLSGTGAKLLARLAGRDLRNAAFHEVIHMEGAELHRARIAFQIPPSNPSLINPQIHLGPASFGTLPSGERTVRHLSASGGTPPYRFYLVPEQGGPGVPPWLTLAADGTLTVEPPVGSTVVNLPVEVVDGNGEHSVGGY